jgi:ferredoxin
MHKLSYLVENVNTLGCTGCGRCVSYCPVNIDIRKFIEAAVERAKVAEAQK